MFFRILMVSAMAAILHAQGPVDLNTQTNGPTAADVSHLPVFDQPILWTGTDEPSTAVCGELVSLLSVPPLTGPADAAHRIEGYLAAGESPFAASLHAHLGHFYRYGGRYSLALQHWQQAWDALSTAEGPNVQGIGDYIIAYWSKLLASLGRVEELDELYRATVDWPINPGPLGQMLLSAREAFPTMLNNPGVAFKCGTFALGNVAIASKVAGFDLEKLRRIPSPRAGFSVQELIDIAADMGFDVVAVRATSNEIAAPSVVHWKENHYAAITERKGNNYRVSDPTFGFTIWLPAETILAEASGVYLMEGKNVPQAWAQLQRAEAENIHGRGIPDVVEDNRDHQCNPPPGTCCGPGQGGPSSPNNNGPNSNGPNKNTGGNSPNPAPPRPQPMQILIGNPVGGVSGGGAAGGGGGASAGCGNCGMAEWRVSEPFLNIWLEDTPLWYYPSHGPGVFWQLAYKQRDTDPLPSYVFSTGPRWRNNWLSWIDVDPTDDTSAVLHIAGGGTRQYTGAGVTDTDGTLEEDSSSRLRIFTSGTSLDHYEVVYPDGSRDVYSQGKTNSGTLSKLFLKEKVDANGQKVILNYVPYSVTSNVKLDTISDADGLPTKFFYDPTNVVLVTSVVDPFTRTNLLKYDNTGLLTNIIDVAGLTTSFSYEGSTNHWITNMVTPYGTNGFQFTDLSDAGSYVSNPQNTVNRSVRVTQPDGGNHLYVYRDESPYLHTNTEATVFIPNSYSDPDQVPDVYTIANDEMFFRNTWHWGPRQYSHLSSGYLSTLNTYYLTNSDYNLATLRHWSDVPFTNTAASVVGILIMQREPSADDQGLNPGRMTWYAFDSASPSPVAITRVLPDPASGTGRSSWVLSMTAESDSWWHRPLQVDETYRDASGIQTREYEYRYDYYGDSHNLLQILKPDFSHLVDNLYDANRHLTNQLDALGYETDYFYNGNGLLTGVKYPSGLAITNYYFTSGMYSNWLATNVVIGFATNTYTYTNGLLYTQTDPLGTTTTNTWDKLQRLTRRDVSGLGATTYAYDKLDLIQVVDPLGLTNSYGYDVRRRLVASTNAIGTISRYGYCSCDSLDFVTNAFGVVGVQAVTGFSYDNSGLLLVTSFPDAYSRTNVYDKAGRLFSVGDANGVVTNTYNLQSFVVGVSNALGRVQSAAFDIYDVVTNAVNVNGVTVTNTYDALLRLVSSTTLGAGTRTNIYTSRGITNVIDELGRSTTVTLDALGRTTNMVNANGEANQLTYDPAGRVKTLTDGNGHLTAWSYDAFGNLTNKTDAVTNVLRLQYDADLRVTNRWTPQKGNTSYAYNAAGSLTNVGYPISHSLSYSYDALQRLSSMTDGSGSTIYLFDGAGQQLFEAGPFSDSYVSTSYNNRRRVVLEIQEASFGWWDQFHGYDAAGQLTSFANPAGNFSFTLGGSATASPMVRKILFPSGSYITNTYDSVARLSGTYLETSSNTVLNSHTYGYNPASLRTNMTATAGNFWTYGYDNANQLKTAIGKESGGVTNRLHEQFSYVYDAAGNLTQRTMNTMTNSFTPNNVNELSSITRGGFLTVAGTTTTNANSVVVNTTSATRYADASFAATGFSPTAGANMYTAVATGASGRSDTNAVTVNLPTSASYSYDWNGNLTSDGNLSYAYDDENQLIRITATNSWSTGFIYDGKMRLRFRYESNWVSSAWTKVSETRYVYDGMLLVQERDGNNVPTVTYTRGPDLSSSQKGAGGVGGLVCRTDMALHTVGAAGAYNFYHSDGNGNVTALINDHQMLSAKYSYDPYGNTLSQSGPMAGANRMRFSSKEFHENSGLYYYGYRFYSPNVQRWLNRDPLTDVGFVVETHFAYSILGANPYLFTDEQPISRIDPLGLSFSDMCKDVLRDIGTIVKDKLIGKAKKSAKDKAADIFSQIYGGNIDDGKASCSTISSNKPGDMAPGQWESECQACAAYQCATSASTVGAAETCLKQSMLKCDAGVRP